MLGFFIATKAHLVAASGEYSLLAVFGLLIALASLVAEHRALECMLGSAVVALRLSCSRHVGCSWTRVELIPFTVEQFAHWTIRSPPHLISMLVL